MTFYYKDNSGDVNNRATQVGNPKFSDTKYAGKVNGIFYIQDIYSGRYVTFKAYLNSFSLNIIPTVELENSIFMIDPFVSRGQTIFRYNISVDVPANDADEAVSNMAKMQELFRYVGTLGTTGTARTGDNQEDFAKATEFSVFFSNLINRGDDVGGPPEVPFSGADPSEIIANDGIRGIIKKVEFNPSMDTGFFTSIREGYTTEGVEVTGTEGGTQEAGADVIVGESNPSRSHIAKHYTLELELLMINAHDSLGQTWPFMMDIF